MKEEPLVSVRLMVYNNEPFIRETIESILIQKTVFKVEVVVGDDFSSDNTLNIIRTYKSSDKISIRILDRPKKGEYWRKRKEKDASVRTNFMDIIENCKGKYIALLDGDDYWTDPLKLQKQVDLLEANPHLVACHHWQRLAVKKRDIFEEIEAPKEDHGYFPFETDVRSIFENKMRVKTRTVMFRNILKTSEITLNFPNTPFTDVPLSFVLGKYGKFGFIDEEMAVYRQTNAGVSLIGLKELGVTKFRIQHFKYWIEIWDYADKYYDYKYHKEATVTVFKFYKVICQNISVSVHSLIKILYYNVFVRKLPIHRKIFSSKWIVLYYAKKFILKLKSKISAS